MAIIQIQLQNDVWSFDENDLLGEPGGFGEVFRGNGQDGKKVAVKRLRVDADTAAHREMSIGERLSGQNHNHVVPVWDFGQDANSSRYFIVMPVCDESLESYVTTFGRLSWVDAKPIVCDIVNGLIEVDEYVHRDLKPANILKLDGRWCIADFGIAKFTEDSTSRHSLKRCLTPQYAAPEQFKLQSSTNATDVYALACIIHRLLNGSVPFDGTVEEIAQGHLQALPPDLSDAPDRLQGLVKHMLRKNPETRPSSRRCLHVFKNAENSSSDKTIALLTNAASVVADQEAESELQRLLALEARQTRDDIASEANIELCEIMGRIFDAIESTSESISRTANSITMGSASLKYLSPSRAVAAGSSILAYSTIAVEMNSKTDWGANSRYLFPANLVFSTEKPETDFRWREMAFCNSPSRVHHPGQGHVTYTLNPGEQTFYRALGVQSFHHALAYGPWEVDGEDEEDFRGRWLRLFAKAAKGELRAPSTVPLDETFFG